MNDNFAITGSPTNFDVKEQAFSGNEKGIPLAGYYEGRSAIGEYINLPQSGKYIVVVINGVLSFIEAPQGELKLLNNSLGWTETKDC